MSTGRHSIRFGAMIMMYLQCNDTCRQSVVGVVIFSHFYMTGCRKICEY